jgi:hypothetical protein
MRSAGQAHRTVPRQCFTSNTALTHSLPWVKLLLLAKQIRQRQRIVVRRSVPRHPVIFHGAVTRLKLTVTVVLWAAMSAEHRVRLARRIPGEDVSSARRAAPASVVQREVGREAMGWKELHFAWDDSE